MSLATKFRGDVSVIHETLRDVNVALDAGIQLIKLEKHVISADGVTPFEANQSFGGHRITDIDNPIIPTDAATKAYVDASIQGCEHPVDYMIHYLKITAGPPTGVAQEYEICLNLIENKYYIFTGGSWGPGLVPSNHQRFIFGITGTDISGNSGECIANNKVYEFTGVVFHAYIVSYGCSIFVRYSSYNCANSSGWVYDGDNYKWIEVTGSSGSISAGLGLEDVFGVFNVVIDNNYFEFTPFNEITLKDSAIGSDKLKFGTGVNEINTDDIPEGSINKYLTSETIDDRVNDLLQEGEGIDLNYVDGSDSLTISCELASDGDNTTNKGVASFNNESFGVDTGFVSLEVVDGGQWTATGYDANFNSGYAPHTFDEVNFGF